MRITFTEIEISFDTESPDVAYRALAKAMEDLGREVGGLEWSSGNFSTDESMEPQDTEILIP